jgi:hypothetical protein
MAIELDQPTTSTRPPVIGARGLGQTVVGMVVNKEMRSRTDKDGKPIMNSRGKPAQEEVLTVMLLDGTTGTVSGGDLADDWTPEAGTVARLIFKGFGFGKLIDARNQVGGTQVGDVVMVTASSATIWRGPGDIAAKDVTDDATIGKARAKGLSVGWDIDVTYRRAAANEAALAAKAEQLHMENKARIALDVPAATPAVDLDDAF